MLAAVASLRVNHLDAVDMEMEGLITGKLKKEKPCETKPQTEEDFVEEAVDAKVDPSVFKQEETHEEKYGSALISGTPGSMINHVLDRMNGDPEHVMSEAGEELPAYSFKDEYREIAPEVRPTKDCPEAQTVYDAAYNTALAAARSGASEENVMEAARSAAYGTGITHDYYEHESLFDSAEIDTTDHGIQHVGYEDKVVDGDHPTANQLLDLGSGDEAYLDRADTILEETLDKDMEAKEQAK